uniref:Uncharacterized protein n=1 Tax=Graphocephala atropunctata TaxID=36148 RepID=A0A1B6L0Y7_9HEMI
MNKKKTLKKDSSARCRGGGAPVRIKLARVVHEQGAVLKNRTSNGDLYEDTMLLVKDQTVSTKRRGRPKKTMAQMPRPIRSSPEVIYVPSVRDERRYVPFATGVNRASTGQFRHTVRCVIQSTNPVPVVGKSVLALTPKQQEGRIEWPDNLKELVATWDDLPESYTRDVVKWLQTPLQFHSYPQMVRDIHHMMGEWNENLANKIHEVGRWWSGCPTLTSTSAIPELPVSPRVVVEAQPNPHQLCSQWSSMADSNGKQ